MTYRSMVLTTALVALVATPAYAQHQQGGSDADSVAQPGMMGGMDMMGPGMMRMMQSRMMGMSQSGMAEMMGDMLPQAATLLSASDALELTLEQTTALEALKDRTVAAHGTHMSAAMSARATVLGALDAETPDFDAYETAFREGMDHMAQAHMVMVRASHEARGILTPGQRAAVMGAMSMMKAMRGGGMGGAMMSSPGFDHSRP